MTRRRRMTRKVRAGLDLLIDMGRADYEVAPENWDEESQAQIEAALAWFEDAGFLKAVECAQEAERFDRLSDEAKREDGRKQS